MPSLCCSLMGALNTSTRLWYSPTLSWWQTRAVVFTSAVATPLKTRPLLTMLMSGENLQEWIFNKILEPKGATFGFLNLLHIKSPSYWLRYSGMLRWLSLTAYMTDHTVQVPTDIQLSAPAVQNRSFLVAHTNNKNNFVFSFLGLCIENHCDSQSPDALKANIEMSSYYFNNF